MAAGEYQVALVPSLLLPREHRAPPPYVVVTGSAERQLVVPYHLLVVTVTDQHDREQRLAHLTVRCWGEEHEAWMPRLLNGTPLPRDVRWDTVIDHNVHLALVPHHRLVLPGTWWWIEAALGEGHAAGTVHHADGARRSKVKLALRERVRDAGCAYESPGRLPSCHCERAFCRCFPDASRAIVN